MRLNPFRDVTKDPRAEFRKQMAYYPEQIGNPQSGDNVRMANSQLSHKEYNEVFEGDCWSIPNEKGLTTFNLRPLHFQSGGDETSKLTSKAEEGFLGTSLGAERSHAHFAIGNGDDLVQHDGNSQRNISVVEAGAGEKLIVQNLGGGDDKSVLYLNGTSGTIFVSGEEGHDTLEIHSRNPEQTYTLIRDPEQLPDPNDGFKGLRIVTQSVEEIKEFKDY